MKPKDEENWTLTNQIEEWSIQMDFLAAKQNAAAIAARELAQEIAELYVKHKAATLQLRNRQLDETPCNMWENIGEGG
ncbi:MAG: hypothetical protein ACXWT4_05715 [Methylobacter sp.]